MMEEETKSSIETGEIQPVVEDKKVPFEDLISELRY